MGIGRKFLIVFTALMVFCSSVDVARAIEIVSLPEPGTMVRVSSAYQPPILTGLRVDYTDPFRFDFILDKGDARPTNEQLKTDSNRLVKYFLASLTVPEKDLWVNLSPYEKDRIVPDAFGHTEMGRDLLAQDYILKQITASIIYPGDDLGKEFWAKVYAEAAQRYGTTDVPVDTFNKVWIVPEKATVYESKDAAFVVESKLKVMLDEDYLALENNRDIRDTSSRAANKLGSDIVREVVIPVLEKEVNEGKNFATLRQVYNSLILATWYKRKVKAGVLAQAYVDKQKTSGIDITDKNEKEKIWLKYVEAFKKGAFDLIQEAADPVTQEFLPRKYFSGGMGLNELAKVFVSHAVVDLATVPHLIPDQAMRVAVVVHEADPAQNNDYQPFLEGIRSLAKGQGDSPSITTKEGALDYLQNMFGSRRINDGSWEYPDIDEAITSLSPDIKNDLAIAIWQWKNPVAAIFMLAKLGSAQALSLVSGSLRNDSKFMLEFFFDSFFGKKVSGLENGEIEKLVRLLDPDQLRELRQIYRNFKPTFIKPGGLNTLFPELSYKSRRVVSNYVLPEEADQLSDMRFDVWDARLDPQEVLGRMAQISDGAIDPNAVAGYLKDDRYRVLFVKGPDDRIFGYSVIDIKTVEYYSQAYVQLRSPAFVVDRQSPYFASLTYALLGRTIEDCQILGYESLYYSEGSLIKTTAEEYFDPRSGNGLKVKPGYFDFGGKNFRYNAATESEFEEHVKELASLGTNDARAELDRMAMSGGVDFLRKALVSEKLEYSHNTWDHPEIDLFFSVLSESTRDKLAEEVVKALNKEASIYVLGKLNTFRSFDMVFKIIKADLRVLDGNQSRDFFNFFFVTVFGQGCPFIKKDDFRRLVEGLTPEKKEIVKKMAFVAQPSMPIRVLEVLFPELDADNRNDVAAYAFAEKSSLFKDFRFEVWGTGNNESVDPVVDRMVEIAAVSGLQRDAPDGGAIRTWMGNDSVRVVLAKDAKGTIVGYLISSLDGPSSGPFPHFMLVVVDKEGSLGGLGSALVKRTVEDYQMLGYNYAELQRSIYTSDVDFTPRLASRMGWSWQPEKDATDRDKHDAQLARLIFFDRAQALLDSKDAGQGSVNGGIDLGRIDGALGVDRSAGAGEFKIDPAMLQRVQNASGMTPVIVSIEEFKSLAYFLAPQGALSPVVQ